MFFMFIKEIDGYENSVHTEREKYSKHLPN